MSKFADLIDQELDEKNEGIVNVYSRQTMNDKLFLRFCKTKDVAIKNDKFLNFKGRYLCKMSHLK